MAERSSYMSILIPYPSVTSDIPSDNIAVLQLLLYCFCTTIGHCEFTKNCEIGHDGVFLEFRASKPWNLSTLSVDNLKAVTATLWEAMDMGDRFMDNAALHRDVLDFGKEINFFM